MGVVSVFIKKMQFLIYVFLKAWYAYRRTYFSELGYVEIPTESLNHSNTAAFLMSETK